MNKKLNDFTTRLTTLLGRAWATMLAICLVVIWLLGIPLVGLSDTYQLVINTTTTIITFIMVFVVQNTQNREGKAVQAKLDLILMKLGIDDPHDLHLEDLPDKQIEKRLDKIVGKKK